MKHKYDATRIVNDRPKYEWDMNGVKKLLKKINTTGDVAQKNVSGRHKSVLTEENNNLLDKKTLTQMKLS